MPSKLPRFLSLEETRRLFAVATGRDRLLLEGLYATGGRISELLALTWADVDLGEKPSVRLQSKGGDERAVPIGKPAAEALRATRDGHGPGERVFPDFTRHRAWRRIRALGKKAGIPNVYPHRLRHSFITDILDNYGESGIIAVMEMAGHKSAATTGEYWGLTRARLDEQRQIVTDALATVRGQGLTKERLRRGLRPGELHWR